MAEARPISMTKIFRFFKDRDWGQVKQLLSLFYNFPYQPYTDNVVNAFPVGR